MKTVSVPKDAQTVKMAEAHFLYNPPDKGLYCHAPSLLRTFSGDLLAVWYAYPEDEHSGGSLVLARRPAGQEDWEPSRGVLGPFAYSAGNPVVFQDPAGKIWLLFVLLKGNYWNDAELQGACSADGGLTWWYAGTLWRERGLMVRHPPVAREDGLLLLPAYDEGRRQTVVLGSRRPYAHWKETYRFEDPPLIQAAIVREGPSRLALIFRPWTDPRRIWRSHSSNDGASWSGPVRTPLPNPLSGIGAFLVEDQLAIVYNHTEKHERHPLSVSVSPDGGVSWGGPCHIDTISYEVCYPSFLNDGSGRIHGVYTYNRRMIKYVSFTTDQLK